ncbi:MAG: radical SAM protein [Coriobacteriales bacterium]|jgi:uncharacterized radical SAM superfamily Fe-S cluster-containing enzyme|nr:radical SAM protein [Coriobacteriales bacterium]
MSELLHSTRALCPECLEALPAQITADAQGKVWMTRVCPEHGQTSTLVWPDVEHYRWISSLAFAKVKPDAQHLHPTNKPCPTGCGICQRHARRPTLVEIEVTQRCNLRCPVCFMSAEGSDSDVPLPKLREFYESIATTVGTQTGVQLTGGEPTVRADLPDIIRMGRERGFWGIEVNTNGVVISQDNGYLESLVAAGLTGIYLQFDGVTPEPYQQIRAADLLACKLRAVERCREAGVQVVLAMTIVSGINAHQIGAVIDYALANVDVVAGVALQPAFTSGRFDTRRVVPLTMGDVIFLLQEQTDGLIQTGDIWPLGCSHPLCDTGTFLVEKTALEGVAPVPAAGVAPGTATPAAAPGTATPVPAPAAAPGTSAPAAAPGTSAAGFLPITRDLSREDYLALYDPASPQGSVFLDVLTSKGIPTARGLSLIIMNYMDAYTMDLERMEECSMFVTMADGRLIPFCSYQLTNCGGTRVYPPFGIEKGL